MINLKNHSYYWIAFREDKRSESKAAQLINGDMYIVGHKQGIALDLVEIKDRIKPINRMKTVYIAGAYRWRGSKLVPSVIGEIVNIYRAWKVSRDVWSLGFAAVCPHANSLLMDRFGVTPDTFLKGDLDILAQCDYILMMPEWEKSTGATEERMFAIKSGIPIFYSVETMKEVSLCP